MSDTVTIIGSIASVIGAVIALVAAARARSARDAAEIAENEAKSLQQVIHGERLHSEVRLARNTFAKYGPAASSTQLDGSDCTADADRAQRHLLSIKDLLPHAAQKSPVVEQILGRIPDHIFTIESGKLVSWLCCK